LHRIRDLVRDAGEARFSPAFTSAVMERVDEGPPLRLIQPLRGGILAAAAGIVLLALSGLLWWSLPRTLEAGPGQRLTATLPDGSTVELNSASTLRYRTFAGRSDRQVELDGEAFFSVEPGSAPFIVQTHNARIQVLGTRFNVSTRPGLEHPETRVAVEEGRVQVFARHTLEGVVLSPSEATVVPADTTHPRPPTPAALDRALLWRRGGLDFNNFPLRLAVDELARRYGRDLALDPTLATVSVGYIQPAPASLESVLADICASLGLAFRRTANGYEIYQP
jgi:ferric-dicitrate binding protein FerR (iron transport regulator)